LLGLQAVFGPHLHAQVCDTAAVAQQLLQRANRQSRSIRIWPLDRILKQQQQQQKKQKHDRHQQAQAQCGHLPLPGMRANLVAVQQAQERFGSDSVVDPLSLVQTQPKFYPAIVKAVRNTTHVVLLLLLLLLLLVLLLLLLPLLLLPAVASNSTLDSSSPALCKLDPGHVL
jgi:hypothetical protein